MRIIRGLAAAAILAGGALGVAGPAHADQVMQGVYNYLPQDAPAETWTIYPSCVPVVGDLRVALELPVACRLHVSRSGSTGVDANLAGGMWQYNTNRGTA